MEIYAGNDDEIEIDEDHGLGIKHQRAHIDDDLSTTSNVSASAPQQELKEKLAILAAQWGSTQ